MSQKSFITKTTALPLNVTVFLFSWQHQHLPAQNTVNSEITPQSCVIKQKMALIGISACTLPTDTMLSLCFGRAALQHESHKIELSCFPCAACENVWIVLCFAPSWNAFARRTATARLRCNFYRRAEQLMLLHSSILLVSNHWIFWQMCAAMIAHTSTASTWTWKICANKLENIRGAVTVLLKS